MKIGFVNMIQDVAEKQGNINVDVVTKALADSKQRIISKKYMTAGMGDGGACHPRDNIALRWMAQKLNLQYDIFDAIMNAREVQAKNLAKYLVKLAEENNMTMVQLAQAFVNSRPFVTSNIIGATTMDQLQENIESVDVTLTDEILDKINLIHNNNPNPSP